MAVDDSVIIIEGSTAERIATDFITAGDTAAHYQYMKVAWGADGTATPVSATTGTHLPVQLYIGGSAITSTGNALDVNLQTSDITVNTNGRGLTAEYTAGGGTYSGDVVGVTGEITITDTVTVKGSGKSADVLYVSGYGGMTAVEVSAIDLDIRGLTATYTAGGGTYSGDIVGVTGEVSANVVNTVTVAGSGKTADVQYISGWDGMTAVGITWDAGISLDVTVQNTVTVSSTDLDIRGLSMGVHGSTAMHVAASTDTVIIQGVTKAYPVAVHLTGISGDGNQYPVGISGDELKVSFSNGTVSATITDTDINLATVANGVTIGITFDDGTIFPISTGATLGITWDATSEIDANITNASIAVTSTDLDIRALNSADTITAMGFTGPAGLSAMPSILFSSAGLTAMPLGVTEGKNQINGVTVDLLHVRVEGSGITNVTALQVQGRNDGLTLFPVAIQGVSGTGTELGVVFNASNTGTQTVTGAGVTAHNSPYLNSLLVGVSAPNDIGNEAIVPVGISGGALNVNLVNSDTVTFSATVDANTTVTNAANAAIPVHGATTDATAIYVSGTAGSTSAWPIFVQGYTTGNGTDAPIGVTFEFKHELHGLSGGLTALHNALVGVTQEIGGLASTFTTTNTELGNLNSNITNTNNNLNTMVSAYVTNDVPSTIPVSIVAPTSVKTYQFTASTSVSLAHGSGAVNATAFSSGMKIRLHPDATQGILIGGSDVTTSTGYLLSPGDDIFIEQQFTSTVGIITTSGGSNMTVYVIGY